MFFLPTFQRSFDLVHALRQFSLTVFLLPSILCFFASSYIIDDSCQHYKGNDITGDIEQAINEVRDMAHSAFVATLTEAPRVNNLLVTLFGPDRSRHDIVVEYFWRISRTLGPTTDFVLNCDDQRIKLEEDKFQEPPDPLGVWIDHRYKWLTGFNNLDPCEPATRNLPPGQDFIYAYTMSERVIYLCSHVLDIHIGRSLASYKDADNTGLYIDDLLSLPVILFHELLHTRSFQRKPSSRRVHHGLILLTRDNSNSHWCWIEKLSSAKCVFWPQHKRLRSTLC